MRIDWRQRTRGAVAPLLAALVTFALVAASCGGSGKGSGGTATTSVDEGTPQPGGRAVYGVEADTSGGFCLPEAEAAISGTLVAMSVYDPLVYPNDRGQMVPYLAESVVPSADYTSWTIKLRPGVTFQDGSPLDADTVKLNLDAYRGKNPLVHALLSSIVLQDVADVRVVDPATVVVTTARPWVAFPEYLFLTGRMGMMAKAQLADPASCARKLIGTGPFQLRGDWTPGTPIELVRNPRYWRKDARGRQLPYLDRLTFAAVPEQSQRMNELQGGQLQLMHTPIQSDVNKLEKMADQGSVRLYVSNHGREVRYYMLNAGKKPFSDIDARRAVAYAIDRQELNVLRNEGRATLANGPFDKGVVGHLDGLAPPPHNLTKARDLVRQVKARNGGEFKVLFVVNPDSANQAEAEILKRQLQQAGIDVSIERADQSTEISRALAGTFDVLLWREHPGEDPDTQYLWWYSTYVTNFGKFKDADIDRQLDAGRTTADPAVRKSAYEAVNRRFSSQLYDLWAWYVNWAVATGPRVHGVLGPPLPDGSTPYPLLGGLHPTLGLWVG